MSDEQSPYVRLSNSGSLSLGRLAESARLLSQSERLTEQDRADLGVLARQLQSAERLIRLTSPNLTTPDLITGLRFLSTQPATTPREARRRQLYGLLTAGTEGAAESFDLLKRARMAAAWATLATPGVFGLDAEAQALSSTYHNELNALLSSTPPLA